VRFNPKADISGGRVSDVRGGGGGGGGLGSGLGGLPTGAITGGGIGTTIVAIIIYVIVQLAGGGGGLGTGAGGPVEQTDRYAQCQTGADANKSEDCARRAVELSLESYWSKILPKQTGKQFTPTQIETFTGATTTGCGQASADVGPFYCPTDQTIYLDTTFFPQVLQGQLNGPSGAFVEPYVIAHEFGHHIQNLLGTMNRVRTQQGPTSDSVRLELQADCYAGMWTRGATGTTDQNGVQIFESITSDDITNAIDAAKAVGDDRIQKMGGGDVNPEQWTHGSSEERQRWFTTGYNATDIKQCDTFSTNNL
jgi:predicted metalloprotease